MINQAQIRFMNDRSGLQSVVLTFPAQAACGELAELPIDQRCEVLKGLLVPLRPFGQQSRHIVGSRHGSGRILLILAALYTGFASLSPPWHPSGTTT